MPKFKIFSLLVLLVVMALAYCGPVQPASAQVPATECFWDAEGNWVCISEVNDLTPTPEGAPTVIPPTPTPTIVIKPIQVCLVFFCQYLPIGAKP